MENPFPPDCAARFDPVRLLGAGGFGAVWLAVQRALERSVVVKLLSRSALENEETVRRFSCEAKLTASLRHENIVAVIDHGAGSIPWIAYEYVEGPNLRQLLDSAGPMDPRLATDIGIQVAGALDEAHRRGIFHRDVKPENVLEVTPGTRYKLADFGIARWRGGGAVRTQTGVVLGTPAYLAPEMIIGAPPTVQSDLYALGAMLYELATGRTPFAGPNVLILLDHHLKSRPVPPRKLNERISPGLEAVVLQTLEKEPGRRQESATELRNQLERLRDEGRTPSVPGGRTTVAAVLPGRLPSPAPPAIEPTRALAPPVKFQRPGRPPTRPRGTVLAIVGVLVGCLVMLASRLAVLPVGPSPPPAASRASAGTLESLEPRLIARGSELLLKVDAAQPVAGVLHWQENGAVRARPFGPAAPALVVVGGPALRDARQLEVSVDGPTRLDLVKLFGPHARRLEQYLNDVKIEPLIKKAAALVGGKTEPDRVQRQLIGLLPPSLLEATQRATPLARQWLRGTTDLALRRKLLTGIYRLEVLNAYLQRNGVGEVVRASELLPENWGEHRFTYRAEENSRFGRLPHQASLREPRMWLDGKAMSGFVAWGPGVYLQNHTLGITGGQQPSLSEQLAVASDHPELLRKEWRIQWYLDPGVTAPRAEVLIAVYGADPGTGVLWLQFNGLLDVPLCRPPKDPAGTVRQTYDRCRFVPSDVILPGPNELTMRIRPYPGLIDTSSMWIGHVRAMIFGPHLK